ncbi:MAG: hypothetical protein ABGY96_27520 [bacterium]|nr:hypothetical protein [Gammaproteobacteria bacterium]HIL98041.1 hypothetical protein [Pseudomonadales bacterium]
MKRNSHGILYVVINKKTQGDLYFIRNDGVKSVIQNDVIATTSGHISPDNAWIAVTRHETGTPEVWVERFPNGGLRQRVPVANGN